MKKHWCVAGFFFCLLWGSSLAMATEPDSLNEQVHADLEQGLWVFSGSVVDEAGDSYAYFFQMQRHNKAFHSVAALFDAQTEDIVFFDESQALIANPKQLDWQVGHTFIHFNPINKTWVFGLKTEDKRGFNFKVDMLEKPERDAAAEALRPGLLYSVTQTGYVNGLIQTGIGHQDQFVTAPRTWFRQVWLSQKQDKSHQLSGVLCRFRDGSGFYSLSMLEHDALRGAVAGWFNEEGAMSPISQFIRVKQSPEGAWHISIPSPTLNLELADFVKRDTIIAGFVTKKPGFCMLSQDTLG